MSSSETDSDPEPVLAADTVSSLTAFACLSATRQPDPAGQSTVGWAVETLTTLEFRLVRKDTALHGLIQDCANTIFGLFETVLRQGPAINDSYDFTPDIASLLRPSFLHLLFQYRRLFRVIAARDSKPSSAPLAIVCWVDVILAKLGDVVALIAAGLDGDHPDYSFPESLKVQRNEDNLRAAIQLSDNWDMLPSMLLSERVSPAAKRLTTRLLLGRYILCPALSGYNGVDHTTHQLLSTFAEFVRRGAAGADELCLASGSGQQYLLQQERLTSAMAISLFAAADIAQDPTVNPGRAAAFLPQTMAAAMKLLRFVLNDGGYTAKTNVLNPSDYLDAPVSIIVRWGIVPQWAWSVWLEYSSLHADTIIYLTTTYIRYHSAGSGVLSEVSDLTSYDGRSNGQAGVIGAVINLVFRFISVLSESTQLSAGMMNVLHGSCQLISQWMDRNLCGIRQSRECCKMLIILFGYLSQNEQYFTLNELVIGCLTLIRGQCIREAWKAAAEDSNFCFPEALGHSFIQTKTALSRDDLPKSTEICAGQLMQFVVVMISNGAQPLDLGAFVDFIETVGERVLEVPLRDREFLCETWLLCLATANLSEFDLPFSRTNVADDREAVWCLGMRGGDNNLLLAASFSLYITSATVSVESLTYLEGLEHLLDMVLLIYSRHCLPEDEPLALLVLPTICDAVVHLLQHRNDVTGAYIWANTRIPAICSVLRSISSGEDESLMCDRYGALLRHRLWSAARRVLREMDGEQNKDDREMREGYELVFCRLDGGVSRLLYVREV